MDAYQQSQRFLRPPPSSSMADPHLHHAPPPRQPVPPQAPWYSGQFQYHPSQTPSPPPPQWAPPPHSDHPPPPPPYHAHPPQNHYLPPPPGHAAPPPPHHNHSHFTQPYAQPHQEWGNSNWGHHQGWEYPAHSNEEDWAARARAWASAKTAMDNQQSQSQFTATGRHDEHGPYNDQYPQAVDPQYQDFQQHSFPAASYQQYPVPPGHQHQPAMSHMPETVSTGSDSYGSDGHMSYTFNGTVAGDSSAVFPRQETLSTSPSVHLQEVPSSYSSVTGKEGSADQHEQLYNSMPFPSTSDQKQQQVQQSMPPFTRSVLMEPPHFAYANQSAGPVVDPADQPLNFAPRFSSEHDSHYQHGYNQSASVDVRRGMDPVAALTSVNNWTPAVLPGTVYPSGGPQHDLSMAVPPVISGHSAPIMGRITGQSLQPPVPPIGATFGIGVGSALHPTTGFSSDLYGVSAVPERPKKASVPNWLREEIIKKKSIMTSSVVEHPEEDTEAIEDDADKSFVKGDQASTKSVESSRSTEEDDDDEDYDEAARTAAINQEIKRVLTEVLLKVTDELFDEIATKVVNEVDSTVEVVAAHPSIATQDHELSPSPPSPPSALVVKDSSAKVLVPAKSRDPEAEDVSEKASSHSAGDILGLASYASDDDDNDEVQSSGHKTSGLQKSSEHNGSLQPEIEEVHLFEENGVTGPSTDGLIGAKNNGDAIAESNDNEKALFHDSNASTSQYTVRETAGVELILQEKDVDAEGLVGNDCHVKESRNRPDKNERSKLVKSRQTDSVRQLEGRKKVDEKVNENLKREEDRRLREKNSSKQRLKEQGHKQEGKATELDSRRRSLLLDAKTSKDTDRASKTGYKEETHRKRERSKEEKGDRLKDKPANGSGRQKRRRSSSCGNDSSDDAADDSRRLLDSKKRNLSPSPDRSKRRQVLRSPHSKRSQRRHSPYSSLEKSRGRSSGSRSPSRRRR